MLRKITVASRGRESLRSVHILPEDLRRGKRRFSGRRTGTAPAPRSVSGASRVEFFTGRQYGFMKISSKKTSYFLVFCEIFMTGGFFL